MREYYVRSFIEEYEPTNFFLPPVWRGHRCLRRRMDFMRLYYGLHNNIRACGRRTR